MPLSTMLQSARALMDGRAGALPSATPSAPSSKQSTVTYRHWLTVCLSSLAACQPSGIYTTEGTPGYSLYAGARGWDHSHVLPFVSLNMRSFDRQTAPEDLKVDPPPFAQSMHRFETTLGSLRTRKTP